MCRVYRQSVIADKRLHDGLVRAGRRRERCRSAILWLDRIAQLDLYEKPTVPRWLSDAASLAQVCLIPASGTIASSKRSARNVFQDRGQHQRKHRLQAVQRYCGRKTAFVDFIRLGASAKGHFPQTPLPALCWMESKNAAFGPRLALACSKSVHLSRKTAHDGCFLSAAVVESFYSPVFESMAGASLCWAWLVSSDPGLSPPYQGCDRRGSGRLCK